MNEIERKFLVKNDDYKSLATSMIAIFQGYLSRVPERTVRIRIEHYLVGDDKGFITIKGESNASGVSRYEWENEIPIIDAHNLLVICENGHFISKARHIIPNKELFFEVDEFFDTGLVLAEIELPTEDHEFDKPDWLGKEVTGDKKYYNSNM